MSLNEDKLMGGTCYYDKFIDVPPARVARKLASRAYVTPMNWAA